MENAVLTPQYSTKATSTLDNVAGAVNAASVEKNPKLTPDQVKARLMKSAYKIFRTSSTATDATSGTVFITYYNVFSVDAGYLDNKAALANTGLLTAGNALTPPSRRPR